MGPSGCGKSTFGQLFVPVNIFDGELFIQEIQASHPGMSDEDARIYVKTGNTLSILHTPRRFDGIRHQLPGWVKEQMM
jgi:ABC-type oligopeptide transport system ATPase subunit